MVKVTDMTMIGSFSLAFSGRTIREHPLKEPTYEPDIRFYISIDNHPGRFFHRSALEIREYIESLSELDRVGAWAMTREYSSPPVHKDHPDMQLAPPHVAMLAYIKEDSLSLNERRDIAAKVFKKVYDNDPWSRPHQLETEEFHYWAWLRQMS